MKYVSSLYYRPFHSWNADHRSCQQRFRALSCVFSFLFSLLLFVAFSVIALFLESLKIFLLSESFRPAMLFKQALNLLVIV